MFMSYLIVPSLANVAWALGGDTEIFALVYWIVDKHEGLSVCEMFIVVYADIPSVYKMFMLYATSSETECIVEF